MIVMGSEHKSPGAVRVSCGDNIAECLLPDHGVLCELVHIDLPPEVIEERNYVVLCLVEPSRVDYSRGQ